MVVVLFKSRSGETIITFEIDTDKKNIISAKVEEDCTRIAAVCYPKIKTSLYSYSYLEELLNDYCDAENLPLEKILRYIHENGFYTPYHPSLCIEVYYV